MKGYEALAEMYLAARIIDGREVTEEHREKAYRMFRKLLAVETADPATVSAASERELDLEKKLYAALEALKTIEAMRPRAMGHTAQSIARRVLSAYGGPPADDQPTTIEVQTSNSNALERVESRKKADAGAVGRTVHGRRMEAASDVTAATCEGDGHCTKPVWKDGKCRDCWHYHDGYSDGLHQAAASAPDALREAARAVVEAWRESYYPMAPAEAEKRRNLKMSATVARLDDVLSAVSNEREQT